MEKKCGYKRSDIWLYIQNRMSREEETVFQHHLLQCDGCRKELAQVRQVIFSIRRKEKKSVSFRNWMIAASVACVLAGGSAYWLHRSSLPDSPSLPEEPGQPRLKINPPALHQDKDSIVSGDSASTDTIPVEIIFYESDLDRGQIK